MKKILLKIFIFSLPLLIAYVYVEGKLRKIPTTYSIKKKTLDTKAKEINTVILGSSHALYGIDPEYFKNPTINLSNSSQSLYFDKEILMQQIDNLPKLKTVVFTMSYMALYYDMNDVTESLRTYAYYHYWGIKNHDFSYLDSKNHSIIAFLGVPRVISAAKTGFKQISDEGGSITDYGFNKMDSTDCNKRVTDTLGKQKLFYHKTLIKQHNLKINIDIMEEMLNALKKRNINVYIIYAPAYKTYYQYFDDAQVKSNDSVINVLCKRYDAHYFNWVKDTSFVKQDFYDNDHLNKYGAAKFSTILDSVIAKHNH